MLLGCHESPLIVGFHDDDQFPSINPTSFPSARLIVFDLARENLGGGCNLPPAYCKYATCTAPDFTHSTDCRALPVSPVRCTDQMRADVTSRLRLTVYSAHNMPTCVPVSEAVGLAIIRP